ncbi:uncharacterized protein [Physcomitrium patens]|uniref:Protein XRI1-like n=1 Tax=Physcomitrium patens TaxID=3218 RepID=A0A2K1K8F3_PHYPA|nr:protein XRI1-like [Physcomitrium patens]XP_024382124.1 protein XRI1-like [Physcomitrium patens]PNR50054.1 hypothetical protein PHYPA_011951 [Physcomitrium patens]|eukprot:XP_024382123.1 protein XRI1-like [Physcomitrella patens]
MEIAAFEELAVVDNQIIVGDNPDSWLWREDAFKLDSESYIEVAKSFWDDLTQNDEELFASTPPIVNERESSPSHIADCSQEGDSIGPSDYAAENCGRIKRRRMLHFSVTGDECVPASSPAFDSGSTNDSPFMSCVGSLGSGTDEFLNPAPSSPNSIWFSKDDTSADNSIPEETGQVFDDKCSENTETHCSSDKPKPKVRSAKHGEAPGASIVSSPSSEGEVLQGPLTPFSKGSTPGWRPSPLTRFRVKATPVAYPFNLVKPYSAHGDVTLNDINQRIKSPSPRPTRRQSARDIQKSPAHSGSGLSGKAVVECIKLHTEGKGSITIMKTRG